MRRLGAKSALRSLEHVLVSAGGKLVWPISAEVKEVDRHREGQMADSSFRMSSAFVRFIAQSPILSAKAARSNKSSLLPEIESCHNTGRDFCYPSEVSKEGTWGFTSTETIRAY